MPYHEWLNAVKSHEALKLSISQSEEHRAKQARWDGIIARWRYFFDSAELTTAQQLLLYVEAVLPLESVDLSTANDGLKYAVYLLTPTAGLQKACFSTHEARQQAYIRHALPPELAPDFSLSTCRFSELVTVFLAYNDPAPVAEKFEVMLRTLDEYAALLRRRTERAQADLQREGYSHTR